MNQRYNVRPGKGQSMFGFIVGIIFVLLGFTVVLPTFGTFGIVWVLFAIVYLAIGNCVKRQLILYATCHHYLLMN